MGVIVPKLPIDIVDAELLARVNNPRTRASAFADFYDALSRRVYAYTVRMTGCHDTAADICQDAFIRVYSHLERGFAIVDPLPFCLMIARQRISNLARNRKDVREVLSDDIVVDPYGEIHATDLTAQVGKAVDSLPESLREAFVLRYYDNLSYEDIATLLCEKPGTVRMRVLRAKTALRSALHHFLEADR